MGFHFEKLDVYRQSVDFVNDIYELTKAFPKEEIYGLTSQLRRAALSVPANIAEGSGRYSKKDFGHFLRIARSSIYECIPILEVSLKQKYIVSKEFEDFYSQLTVLAQMTSGLLRSMIDQQSTMNNQP